MVLRVDCLGAITFVLPNNGQMQSTSNIILGMRGSSSRECAGGIISKIVQSAIDVLEYQKYCWLERRCRAVASVPSREAGQ